MYSGWGFPPYVPVAERRKKAAKAVAKRLKKGEKILPVKIEGRVIAKSFWGKSWCDHLESFSDYENRLPRGRTYVRNGSVIHLAVETGQIKALVQGSSLYKIQIDIKPVSARKWKRISENCSGQIDSVIELLQGKLSAGVMKTITDKQDGLFPHPQEIALTCSCPDWAQMCKHVAAVLYGIGARLDSEPELLFKLRKVDHLDLISQASLKVKKKHGSKTRVIKGQNLSDLFGIDVVVETPIKTKGNRAVTSPLKAKPGKKSKKVATGSVKRHRKP